MNNISSMTQNECCGCRSCEQICPVSCIQMKMDQEGFLVPVVDENKCINCGKCISHCPQLNVRYREEKQSAYAAKNRNFEIVEESSSGGIFDVFAKWILLNNGVVFGCAWNEKVQAEHIEVLRSEDMAKLHGSKYVQSDTKNTYQLAEKYLKEGKKVLYSGTACQIAGLYSYLGKEYSELYTIDIICHGTPSPKFFEAYLKWLERKQGAVVTSYNFREKKKKGWGLTYLFSTPKKTYSNSAWTDPYYSAFLDCHTYRECCYQCHYACEKRVGDLTLGDYWGVEKEHPDFYDDMGVSAIIVNTRKGKQLFEKNASKMEFISTDIEKVARQNHNLKFPSKRTDKREQLKKYPMEQYEQVFDTLFKPKKNVKRTIKYMIPLKMKRIIKKVILK